MIGSNTSVVTLYAVFWQNNLCMQSVCFPIKSINALVRVPECAKAICWGFKNKETLFKFFFLGHNWVYIKHKSYIFVKTFIKNGGLVCTIYL